MPKKPTYEELEQRIRELEKFDSERKLAEEGRRNLDYEKSLILDNANEIIAFHNTERRLVWANNTYLRSISGATGTLPALESIKGRKCYEVWGLEQDCRDCPVTRAIKTGVPQQGELTPENQEHWPHTQGSWAINAAPVRNAGGVVIGAIEIARDISERKRAEKELKESENRLRSFMNQIQGTGWLTDRELRFLLSRGAGLAQLGLKPDQVVGMSLQEFFGTDDEDHIVISHHRRALRGESVKYEQAYNGITFESRLTPMLDEQGKITGVIGLSVDITERKRAEEALQESNRRFNQLAEQSRSVAWEVDADGLYTYVSVMSEAVYGYRPDQIVGKMHFYDLYPEAGRGEFKKSAFEVMATKEPFKNLDNSILTKDGRIVWVSTNGSPLLNADGTRRGYRGSDIDITERKQAEEMLRESEIRFRGLIEGLKEAVVYRMSLPDGEYEYFSPSSELVFGYSPEEFISNPLLIRNIIHPDFAGYFQEKWRELCDGKVDPSYEYMIVDAEGIEKWIIQSNKGIFDDQGAIIAIEGICRDITLEKNAQEALGRSQKMLARTESIAHVGSWVLDLTTNRMIWSDETYRIFGFKPQEFAVTYEAFLEAVHSEERAAVNKAYSESLLEGRDGYEIEHRIVRRDTGEVCQVHERCIHERDEAGSILRSIGMVQDITDRKRAEEERDKLHAQLIQAQKMESIGTLAGGIAHDFNNMLSPIMIHSQMAMMDLPPDSPVQQGLKEIYKAGERARDLVKQILTFARKSEGKRVQVKASLIVKEAVKFLGSSLPTTIDIHYDLRTEKDIVLADPTQLNQVIMNLCTNASHAMEERGGVLEVILENEQFDPDSKNRITGLEPGRYVKLTVKDTGPGIEPEIMDKIFEPYFTTKEVGKGTGMGLPLVHGLVLSYGGAITVQSEVGQGTAFYVYLPLVEGDRDVLKTVWGTEQLPTGTERILFVDDEQAAVVTLQFMLERLGYKVTARTSSIEALEAFRHNPEAFDLVITDQTMPNMTGKELAGELMLIRPDIPIILCTGFSEYIDEHRAKAMGIRAFVMKPIVMSQMADTIREVLDVKDSAQV
jgi:PAS domain S-box-containing protein